MLRLTNVSNRLIINTNKRYTTDQYVALDCDNNNNMVRACLHDISQCLNGAQIPHDERSSMTSEIEKYLAGLFKDSTSRVSFQFSSIIIIIFAVLTPLKDSKIKAVREHSNII